MNLRPVILVISLALSRAMQMVLEAPSSAQTLLDLDISKNDSAICNQGLERSLRLFTSEKPGPVIESAVRTDFLTHLFYLIQTHQFTLSIDPLSRAIIVNALKNIANLVSGSAETTRKVMSREVIQLVMGMLWSPDLKFKNEAVFILGNVAADCGDVCDILMSANVMPSLMEIFRVEMNAGFVNADLGINALWAFKNFYNSQPGLDLETLSPILKLIFRLYSITTPITENYMSACMEAMNILRVVITNNPTMIFGDFMFVFVKALPLNPEYVLPIIGDLVLENDEYAIKFVEHGGLQMAMSALGSLQNLAVRREIFWILGNSCSASQLVSRQIIEVGLVPYAIASLSGSQPIANEAGWVIVEAVRLCLQIPTLASGFINVGIIQGIFNLWCMALSPIGVLTYNTCLLISQSLVTVHTLFNCEPDRVRYALSNVLPREDIDFKITVDQLFSFLMSMDNPILVNNASVLYQTLKRPDQSGR